MIAYDIIALSLILVTANGKNKFALGLDASQLDQVSQDNQLALAVDSFVHDKAGNTGKPKSLRGFDGVSTEAPADAGVDTVGEQTGRNGFDVVDNNVSAEIGSNDASGTVPTTKMERSLRLAGAPAGVSRWQV